MMPEDISHEILWKYSRNFLGPFVFLKVEDWKDKMYSNLVNENKIKKRDWQFEDFLVDI